MVCQTLSPDPIVTGSALLGAVVATITARWSKRSSFTQTLSFGPPYSNDQRVFAISGNDLIVKPSGPGVFRRKYDLNVTIVAAQ